MAQLDEIRIAQFNATVRVWEKGLHELMLKPMLRRVEELIETWRVIEEGEEKTIGNGDNVLVADETNVDMGYYFGGEWCSCYDGRGLGYKPTHWQPLPKPPKEK